MKLNNERTIFYDWLRIVATFFVVVGHSAYLNIHTRYGGIDYILPTNLNYTYNSNLFMFIHNLVNWIYGFHMPLFFFLSGAVFCLKPLKKFDIFFKSKVKRLYIPYFLTGLLFMIPIKYLCDFYSFNNFLSAINSFWMDGAESGHLWFLPVLFWCMMVFYIIKKILNYFKIESNCILFLISIFIPKIFLMLPLPINIVGLSQACDYLFWFTLGYIFEKNRKFFDFSFLYTIIQIIICIFISILNYKYNFINTSFLIFLGIYESILISHILNLIFKNAHNNKVFVFITSMQFGIYLFHDPLEYVTLKLFFNNNLLNTSFGCYIYLFCRIFGVIIASIIIMVVIRYIRKKILKFKTLIYNIK